MPSNRSDQQIILEMVGPYIERPRGDWELGRINQYSLVKLLGRGGMGAVFLAVDDFNRGEAFALKLLLPWERNDAGEERFVREISKLKRIRHLHIVALFDSGFTRSQRAHSLPYFVMEYIPGHNLRERLSSRKQLSQLEVLRISIELCAALQEIHDQQIIHRDIKPENIMFDLVRHECTKLMDFGLAYDDDDRRKRLTQEGSWVGTVHYVAPERISDSAVSARSDLFSVGCVIYEILTGKLAFPGSNLAAVTQAILNGTPKPIQEFAPDVNEALNTIVMDLLQKDETNRPELQRVLNDLQAIASDLQERYRVGGKSCGMTRRQSEQVERIALDQVTCSAQAFLPEGRILLGLTTISNQLFSVYHGLANMRARLLRFIEETGQDLTNWSDKNYRDVATKQIRRSLQEVFKYCLEETRGARETLGRMSGPEGKLCAQIQAAAKSFHDRCDELSQNLPADVAGASKRADAIWGEARKLIRRTALLQLAAVQSQAWVLDSLSHLVQDSSP